MSKISICQSCSIEFTPGPGCKGTYCSRKCRQTGIGKVFHQRAIERKEKTKIELNNKCINCDALLMRKAAKFCSKSCSTSFYNRYRVYSKRTQLGNCIACGNITKRVGAKSCSLKCSVYLKHIKDPLRKKKLNAAGQSRYRAKQLRQLHPEANKEKVKLIYLNCPEGYEVDHIIPLSRGGWHHENNLQYLTISENRKKGNRYIG
jgi:5-methylcytosine-specific restriction endonuclease McrA